MRLFGRLKFDKLVHRINAPSPIVVTPSAMLTLVRLRSANKSEEMLVEPFPMCTSCKPRQNVNAPAPMLVAPFPIDTLAKEKQVENAPFPMLVMPLPTLTL